MEKNNIFIKRVIKMLEEISIEIIRMCPNNCIHCSSLSDECCTEVLDYDHFISVVQDAKKLGAKTICLSGGEPFLHDKIVDMIEFVSSLDLHIFVYTSGIILGENGKKAPLDKNILKIISKKVTKLIFNIEAAKPDTYDKIMGTTGCFEIMKQSINCANNLSIRTEAHFVPMKLNIGETYDVIDLCKDLKISELSFLRLVLQGRALLNKSEIYLSDKELAEYKLLLNKIKEQSELPIRIGIPFTADLSSHRCKAAKGKLSIRYDGFVFPCEVFKNSNISHGLNGLNPENMHNMSLRDIYDGSSYLQWVRKLSQDCSQVDCFEICIGQRLIDNGA